MQSTARLLADNKARFKKIACTIVRVTSESDSDVTQNVLGNVRLCRLCSLLHGVSAQNVLSASTGARTQMHPIILDMYVLVLVAKALNSYT